jgi:hypothetical protein
MTKKEYIITLLSKLSSQWLYADGLRLVVEQTHIQDSVIDGIYDLLSKSLQEVSDNKKKESLTQSLTVLQKIQQLEHDENIHRDEELDTLLSQI